MWLRFLFIVFLIASAPAHAQRTLMVFGDSLSAGFGLPQRTGWVTLLEQRLARDGYAYKVVNASISGETTVGGKNRIERALRQHKPEIVILELGANDGLRGARLSDIRRNLSAIVEVCKRYNAEVLVVGMRIPPNYGRTYTEGFHALFAEVARQHGTSLVPFMLDGFADRRDLFQHDGIHPVGAAQSRVLDNIYQHLQPMLRRSG
jgi:acyl-CoA thioesterase I